MKQLKVTFKLLVLLSFKVSTFKAVTHISHGVSCLCRTYPNLSHFAFIAAVAGVSDLSSSSEPSRRRVNSGGSRETVLGGGPRLKVEVMLVLVVCLRWTSILALLARWMLCPCLLLQLNVVVGTGGKMLGRQEMDL